MKRYLLIEARGEHDSASAVQFINLAKALKKQGAEVEVMLIQNGVMPARAGARADALHAAIEAGITVSAEEFSLRERALPIDSLTKGVAPAPIGRVIERMADGWNVIWH